MSIIPADYHGTGPYCLNQQGASVVLTAKVVYNYKGDYGVFGLDGSSPSPVAIIASLSESWERAGDDVERPARFQQQDAPRRAGEQRVGKHATGRSRPPDDRVTWRIIPRLHPALPPIGSEMLP